MKHSISITQDGGVTMVPAQAYKLDIPGLIITREQGRLSVTHMPTGMAAWRAHRGWDADEPLNVARVRACALAAQKAHQVHWETWERTDTGVEKGTAWVLYAQGLMESMSDEWWEAQIDHEGGEGQATEPEP